MNSKQMWNACRGGLYSLLAFFLIGSSLLACNLESDTSPPSVTLLDEGFLQGIRIGEPFRVHFRADDETRVESASIEIRLQHPVSAPGRITFIRLYNFDQSTTMTVDTVLVVEELPVPRISDAIFVGLDADDGSNRRGLSFPVPVEVSGMKVSDSR